jgi:uncharacterized membrane protein
MAGFLLMLIALAVLFALPVVALLNAKAAKRMAASQQCEINDLQRDIATLRQALTGMQAKPAERTEDAASQTPEALPAASGLPQSATVQEVMAPAADPVVEPAAEPAGEPPDRDAAREAAFAHADATAAAVAGAGRNLLRWFVSGNAVAKLGLLILFLGISFLLKYMASHFDTPISVRLAGVAAADLGLLAWGWRIRLSRPAISLPVQGAAMAVLILVAFAAFRIYHLIPASLAFALLVIFVGFTCVLAVLQDAFWLAVFGIVGGFATPALISTGGGNHITLFSYFAILNAGIVYIATRKAWRALNLLGFACTFVLGAAWGLTRYSPEHYLSSQLFLILLLLMYTAIALYYARREAPALRHYVDGTLVFGTPLAAMALQHGLVQHLPFGMALSALAMGLYYTAAATLVWRRMGASCRMLAEAFLAMAVVFGTLALPFALDGRWTATAWALEGAGVVWIGLRQQRPLAWGFGLLVQAGAWLSFLGTVGGLDPQTALNSNLWLGFLILSFTAFAMATRFRIAGQHNAGALLAPWLSGVLLAAASAWLLAGAWTEILLRTGRVTQINLLIASAIVVSGVLGVLAARLQWRAAGKYAVALQVLACLVFLVRTPWTWFAGSADLFDGPFLSATMLGASLFLCALFFKRHAERASDPSSAAVSLLMLPPVAFCWYGMVLTPLASWLAGQLMPDSADGVPHVLSFYCIGATLMGAAVMNLARKLDWARLRMLATPAWGTLAVASFVLLGTLYENGPAPGALAWIAYAIAWIGAEYLLRCWQRAAAPMPRIVLIALHLLRIAAPWLMIWPVAHNAIVAWQFAGSSAQQMELAIAGWETSGSWSRYIPVWLMMATAGLLLRRSARDAWPFAPLTVWHRSVMLPLAAAWPVLLAVLWNFAFDGAMAPLPYVPLLNPLDITSGFALVLAVAAYRNHPAIQAGAGRNHAAAFQLLAGGLVYLWFNLVLLRSVSHYLHIPYRFDALMASQFVQAMLSLVWCVSALVMMGYAARRRQSMPWAAGAVLLGVVVLKLFTVDLSNAGGIERIISFIGAGLLMVAIGYLAPWPGRQASGEQTP